MESRIWRLAPRGRGGRGKKLGARRLSERRTRSPRENQTASGQNHTKTHAKREPHTGSLIMATKKHMVRKTLHTHTQQGTSPHVHTIQRYWIFSLDASVACQPMNAYATTARAAAATTFLGLHASDVQCTCATLNGSSRRRCLLPTRSMATSRWSASRARCWNLLLSGE